MKKYQVVQRSDGSWSVIRSGSKRASSVHRTQKEAILAGRALATRSSGELVVHEGTGTVIYGSSPQVAKVEKPKNLSLAQRVGSRIQRARLMRGHSLRSLAEALNGEYSHTTLQKFEKGEIAQDTKLLGLLSNVLELRADYFLKQDELRLETIEFRKFSKLGVKAQKQIEEEAFEFFERYLEIESILAIQRERFPQYDLTDLKKEELDEVIEEKAFQLRKKWKLGMNPIPNIHSMLEDKGVKVKMLEARKGFDGISAFARSSNQRVPTIALSNEFKTDIPRLRFTSLYELGHLVLKLPDYLTASEIEKACHRFAGAFLVPKEVFIETFGKNRVKISIPELKAIKAEWGLSFAATMKRAHNLGLISDGRYKGYNIMVNKLNLRTNEPQTWVGDEESYRFSHLVFRALSEGLISMSKACGLLGLSYEDLSEEFELAV